MELSFWYIVSAANLLLDHEAKLQLFVHEHLFSKGI